MRESKSREAIEIPSDMQISSKIVNASGQEIAVCEITVCDQTEMKGGFILYVDKSITANWKAGTALGDIKINGKNIHALGLVPATINPSLKKDIVVFLAKRDQLSLVERLFQISSI